MAPARIVSTIAIVSKPTAAIRNAPAVVRDVCSRDLPERTVTSGGLSQREALATREWPAQMPHPYVPAEVDVWLRERT
jgi:hypothetical protein